MAALKTHIEPLFALEPLGRAKFTTFALLGWAATLLQKQTRGVFSLPLRAVCASKYTITSGCCNTHADHMHTHTRFSRNSCFI